MVGIKLFDSHPARLAIANALEARDVEMAALSKGIGRNHAYIQQFLTRGVPTELKERDRRSIAQMLRIDERSLVRAEDAPNLTYVPLDENWVETDGTEIGAYTIEHYRPRVRGALPEIDVRAGAGEGSVGEVLALSIGAESYTAHKVNAEWLFPEQYLRNEVHVAPNRTLIMPVVGDSMDPSYRPGDRVLVDLSQSTLMEDTVYVISFDDGPPQIKRLQRVPRSKPPQVRIISDNAALETDVVPLDEIRIVGRVCGVVSQR